MREMKEHMPAAPDGADPDKGTVRLTVNIGLHMADYLEAYAKANDLSKSQVARRALREFCAKYGAEKAGQ